MSTKSKKVLAKKSSKVEKHTNAKASAKKATAKKSAPKDRTGMSYKVVREVVQSAPNIRELVYLKEWEDGTKERAGKWYGSRKIVTLKDGTRKVDNDTLLYKGGAVEWHVEVTARLYRDEIGAWRVGFYASDHSLGEVVDMLHNQLAEHEDLSGTLESGDCCGVFYDMAEYGNESEPLTDEQAAKVREYFTPDWIDAKPGPYSAK